jgi:hypothetical protein
VPPRNALLVKAGRWPESNRFFWKQFNSSQNSCREQGLPYYSTIARDFGNRGTV